MDQLAEQMLGRQVKSRRVALEYEAQRFAEAAQRFLAGAKAGAVPSGMARQLAADAVALVSQTSRLDALAEALSTFTGSEKD